MGGCRELVALRLCRSKDVRVDDGERTESEGRGEAIVDILESELGFAYDFDRRKSRSAMQVTLQGSMGGGEWTLPRSVGLRATVSCDSVHY